VLAALMLAGGISTGVSNIPVVIIRQTKKTHLNPIKLSFLFTWYYLVTWFWFCSGS
jgi:hypothetical protein